MGRWERCPDCFRTASSVAFILKELRGHDASLPPEFETWPALPLRDVTIAHADPDLFRRWAWRSLLDYETQSIRYEWVDLGWLVETRFSAETMRAEGQEVQQAPLLLLSLSTTRMTNSMHEAVLIETLLMRRRRMQPTWCHLTDLEQARRLYGQEAATLLSAMVVSPPGKGLPSSAAVENSVDPAKPRRFDPNSV